MYCTAGADFTEATVTLTYEPGEFLQCANISIINDIILEEDERFTIQLSTMDGDVNLVPLLAEIIISDDDGKDSLSSNCTI